MRKTERKRRWRRTLIWLLVLAVVVAAGVSWFHWQCWGLQTTVTQVEQAKLSEEFDGFRIAHLSDIHGHEFGEDSTELLARLAEQEPDLIVVTGDLIDQEKQLAMIPALAKGLSAIAPTYYVTGNHEWGLGTDVVKYLKNLLMECGVIVLTNRYEMIRRDGASFVLAGVDDPNGFADQKTPEELYQEIRRDHPQEFILLLAHRNDEFGRYAAAGYDMVMSGHAHGGIVRLPFTDGLLSPGRVFFPTWTAGVYTLENSTLFASRGLGNNTTPIHGFRLFNRPDLAIVELKTAD